MSFDKNINKPNKKSLKTKTKSSVSKWWKEDPANVHASVFQSISALNTTQSVRHLMNIKFARLYENVNISSYAFGFYDIQPTLSNNARIPTWNVVKSCIDTVANKIAKTRPRIDILTQDGTEKQKQRAENLTQYLDGLFDVTAAYETGQDVFKDAEKFGTGVCYSYLNDENNICVERVLPSELIIDEAEGIYMQPRQMHRRKIVQKDVFAAAYPEFAEQIYSAHTVNVSPGTSTMFPPDMLLVVESWHIPSSQKRDSDGYLINNDGRYSISIENATICCNEYEEDYFPFTFFRWEKATSGFWGYGLAQELAGSQLTINKLLSMIELSQERVAVPRVYLEEGSGVSKDLLLNNGIGDIITYSGSPPVHVAPSALSPEIYQHVQDVYQKCYETTGISQLSAMSQKPAGLDSGIALSTFEDIQSERMALVAQRFEIFFVQLARLLLKLSRKAYENDKNITVNVIGRQYIKKIKWKEVDMDEDNYVMRPFPTNLLPSTPAGKLNTIVQLTQAGFIPKEYGLSLLSFPDLDKFVSLQTAGLDQIYMLIDNMLIEGKYTPPDSLMNLQLAQQLVHTAYLKGTITAGIKPKNLQLLRTFLTDIQSILAAAQQDQSASTGAPTAPTANPTAAPTSQLLPNAAPAAAPQQ